MIRGRDPFADPEQLIRRVYAYVAYRIGDGPDAEDVTSETFARALRHRASYDPRRGEPLSWLIGIARRCAYDALANRPIPVAEIGESPAPGNLEEEAIQRIIVAEALTVLSDRERELIALRYGADLTARRIAEILEVKTNAVEVALHRSLENLRAQLELGAGDVQRAVTELVRVQGVGPVFGVTATTPTKDAA